MGRQEKKQITSSVIIPVYNGEDTIEHCLSCLFHQERKDFEILVVNDASTDNTKNILERILKRAGKDAPKIKVITMGKNSGASAARNIGARASNSEILMFLDADCISQKDWVRLMLSNLKKEDCVAVVSQYNKSMVPALIAKYAFYELSFRDKNKDGFIDSASSCNFCCKKQAFMKIGGFSGDRYMEPAEDLDFFFRLSQLGKIRFVNRARVGHYFRDSVGGYLKQQKAYSRSTAYLFLKKYGSDLFKKDTLQDKTTYIEIVVTTCFIVAFVTAVLLSREIALWTVLIYAVSMIGINRKFLAYLRKNEGMAFMLTSIPIMFLRSVTWVYGVILGGLGFFIRMLK